MCVLPGRSAHNRLIIGWTLRYKRSPVTQTGKTHVTFASATHVALTVARLPDISIDAASIQNCAAHLLQHPGIDCLQLAGIRISHDSDAQPRDQPLRKLVAGSTRDDGCDNLNALNADELELVVIISAVAQQLLYECNDLHCLVLVRPA